MNTTTVPSDKLKEMQQQQLADKEAEIERLKAATVGLSQTVERKHNQLAAQELVIQQLNALLSKFRDDVMFKIGSASPYRHLANGYWGNLKQILPIEPSTQHLADWYKEMVGEPVGHFYEVAEYSYNQCWPSDDEAMPLHAIKPFPFNGE